MNSKTEEFIKKAKLKHGDKYDYSKVKYAKTNEKVVIICREHGEFEQTPNGHLSGRWCSKCSGKYQYTTEEWIKKVKDIHGDKYDYIKSIYINMHTKVIIICKEHGEFEQTPNGHLSGKGCNKCAQIKRNVKLRSNTEEFIEKSKKIHGDKYDYSLVDYVNNNSKVIIICKEHGKFEQTPSNHLSGNRCFECFGTYKSNKNEFIEKAKEIHGDKYDYSLVDYINNNTKVIIICKEHGNFEQTPSNHLTGYGCNNCAVLKRSIKRKSNADEFIEKVKQIHGDKYDYTLVDYKYAQEKIIIICREHGEFEQTPNNHLTGYGCKDCGILSTSNKRRSNTEEFNKKAKEIHGDKYDYSKVKYKSNREKIIIICKEHGEFEQTPSSHLGGSGCNDCGILSTSNKQRSNTEEFNKKAKEIHGDKYDYSLVNYINNNTKVIIICKTHGEFEQTPSSHFMSFGCRDCGLINIRSNTNKFIEKARKTHGDKYDYSKVEYVNIRTKIMIICKTHGEFQQIPDSHLRGKGCPLCVNKTEYKLYNKIKEIYPNIITQFSPDWIGKKRFDFCIPEHNIIIELDGRQHFEQVRNWSSPEEQQQNDKEKEELATEHNYCIIRLLQEDVFYDTYDWFGELLENIQILINEKPTIQNIYMDKNDEYECFL